jgi:hypothetical protein
MEHGENKRPRAVVPICRFCEDGMPRTVVSCTTKPFVIHDTYYEPVRWGDERHWPHDDGGEPEPCDGCNAPSGGVHHHGCCVEECPKCRQQRFGCGCLDDCSYEVELDSGNVGDVGNVGNVDDAATQP